MKPMLRFKAEDGSAFPDWEKMTLGDVGSVAMCKRVFKEQTSSAGDVPFFKIGTFGSKPDAYISRELFEALKKNYPYPKNGTVLLSASGTVGRQVVYQGEDAYYQDSNIVWLEHDDSVTDGFLEQFYSVVQWQGLEGSTIRRLYNKTILSTTFYRPSLPEQRKIADLLSTVDDVIAVQQTEVDAWEQRKKGVIQKLFSQEVRFKADDGSVFPDWEEKKLGNEGTFYGGLSGKAKSDFQTGETCFITYMNVYKNPFARQDMMGCVDVGIGEKQNKVQYGDLLFTQSSETVEEVGLSSVYLHDDEPYLNSFCMGYRFSDLKNVCPEFMGYCMRSDAIRKSIMLLGQGISRINLSAKRLGTVSYRIPSLPEQRKIANCLSSLDDVIVKAKAELAKWQELKKGLLQQMFI